MKLSLTYGRERIPLDVPDGNLVDFIKPRQLSGGDVKAGLERALDEPAGEPLEALSRGRKTCVLVEDDTRAGPHDEMIEALCRRLPGAGPVTFMVAAGSHDVTTPGDQQIMAAIREASSRHGVDLEGVYASDCFSDDFTSIGTTSRGTPVNVNRHALGAELYVVAADIKNHYFAGYSNPLKDFLPGICSYSTIEANHSWALDPRSTFGVHPLHPDPDRRDNPLADDMLEALHMILDGTPAFTLVSITTHDMLLWSAAGEIESVTRDGIGKVDELTSFKVDRVPHAIVSPGGYPQDDSLYNAQRALELTKNAMVDGAQVLLVAECENGIAPNQKATENFYDRLTKPLEEVLDSIKSRYVLYSHKAYKFAELINRLDTIHVHANLDGEVLESAHLRKAGDPQSVVDGWIQEDPEAQVLAFDDGNKLAVYAK
jgi:nickel-dependent lactate racemase